MQRSDYDIFFESFLTSLRNSEAPEPPVDLRTPYVDPGEPALFQNSMTLSSSSFNSNFFHPAPSQIDAIYTPSFVLGGASTTLSQPSGAASTSSGVVGSTAMPHPLDVISSSQGLSGREDFHRLGFSMNARETILDSQSVRRAGSSAAMSNTLTSPIRWTPNFESSSDERFLGVNFGLSEGSSQQASSSSIIAYDRSSRLDVGLTPAFGNAPERHHASSSAPRSTAHPYAAAYAQRRVQRSEPEPNYDYREVHGSEKNDPWSLAPVLAGHYSSSQGPSYPGNPRMSQSATQAVPNPFSSSGCTRSPRHPSSQQRISPVLLTSTYSSSSSSSKSSPLAQKPGFKIRDILQYQPGSSNSRRFISITSPSPSPSSPSSAETQEGQLPTRPALRWKAPEIAPPIGHSGHVGAFEVQHPRTKGIFFHCPSTVGETRCTDTLHGKGRLIKTHLYQHIEVARTLKQKIKCLDVTFAGEACGGDLGDDYDKVVRHVLEVHCSRIYMLCPLCNDRMVTRCDVGAHQKSKVCQQRRS